MRKGANMVSISQYPKRLSIGFHVAQVGKISLSIASVAGAGLLVALAFLVDDKGISYGQIISAERLTHHNLGPAMLVFALAMIAFAGIATWLVSLQASFRVAGPIYLLSRHLELVGDHSPIRPRPIRGTDLHQCHWQEFGGSVGVLADHYGDMHRLLKEIDRRLQDGPADQADLQQVFAQLKEAACRGRLEA